MGVNDLWKLFREEGLMQEWSCETHDQSAQKAVAEQIEGACPAASGCKLSHPAGTCASEHRSPSGHWSGLKADFMLSALNRLGCWISYGRLKLSTACRQSCSS